MKNVKLEVENISAWIKQQVKDAGAFGVVLGLSGGVDSTAACGLAVKALGYPHVLGLLLPSVESFGDDIGDGGRVADFFGVVGLIRPIETTVESIISTINLKDKNLPINQKLGDVAVGNIQARTRMILLRAYAEINNFLVLGTTNRSEDLIGYFTKGGDGGSGVDIEPMAHYYKSEIKEIATYFNVPEDLVNRTPSAGLWEGQTDEGELGFTYDNIEEYWKWKMTKEATETLKDCPMDISIIKKIEKMHRMTAHKRNVPPSYPRFKH